MSLSALRAAHSKSFACSLARQFMGKVCSTMHSRISGRARWSMLLIFVLIVGFGVFVFYPDLRIWVFEHITGRAMMR
jgi:hypothetical protein